MNRPPPPAWLRGPIEGISPHLQPVAYALVEAREDAKRLAAALPLDALWARPGGAASAGFHILHGAGALDRLFTYARGEPLTEAQRGALALERSGGSDSLTAAHLLQTFDAVVDRAMDQLRRTLDETLFDAREVGGDRLPSTVLGLLFHGAEHTTRHIGQLATTVRIVTHGAGASL